MEPTTVFGISRDAEVSTLTKAELVALWNDVGKNYPLTKLRCLDTGAIPQSGKERKYQEVYNEMKRRGFIKA